MEMPVPGSEIFDNPVNSAEIIRMRMASKLKLHTSSAELMEQVDPVTYEILRHRMLMVTLEMGETMRKMSGSLIVTEINDFETSITDEIGDAIYLGPYNTEQGGSMDMAVKWTLENRSENPGIEEGDIFICNDPYVGGGLHQSDVCLYGPLFWEGELFCWTTAICHELDVGGSELAGLGTRAETIFQEPVPLPPMKLVRQGKILQDVEEAFLRRSRLPPMIALDLRSKIGAVKVGNERILEMIHKYGADTVKAVMKRIMDESEKKLRAKLKRLPDGTWSSFVYQDQAREGDRGIYKIVLNMSKKGDHLTFDYRGTDPQMKGPSNCAFSGLRGGILGGLLPVLCGDIPWSPSGILRCIDIISEKGTLNNAIFPAAVSKAPWASGWASGITAIDCLSKMLNTTPDLQDNVWTRSSGSFQGLGFSGMDMRSSPPAPYIGFLVDPMGGGLGARSDKDGVDMGGLHMIPAGRLGDVEMFEYMNPFIYLWRREEPDTGGPGKYRGGLAGTCCLIAHGSDPDIELNTSGAGKGVSMNTGLNGGYPGSSSLGIVLRETNVWEMLQKGKVPSSLEEISCRQKQILQTEDNCDFGLKDVVFEQWHGGGGYMDPLLRDPELVLNDVWEEKVRVDTACSIYGVVIDPKTLELDEAGTGATRSKILKERAERAGTPDLTQLSQERIEVSSESKVERIDENVSVVDEKGGRNLKCTHCGYSIVQGDQSYTDHLVMVEGDITEAGPQIFPDPNHYVDAKCVFRQYYCPGCHTAFVTQVVPVS